MIHTLAWRRYNRRADAALDREYAVPPSESLATMRKMLLFHTEVSEASSYTRDAPLPLP